MDLLHSVHIPHLTKRHLTHIGICSTMASGTWTVPQAAPQYGQGMYCAANYTGELTDGIKEEMAHYQELGRERFSEVSYDEIRKIEQKRNSYAEEAYNNIFAEKLKDIPEDERKAIECLATERSQRTDEQKRDLKSFMKGKNDDEYEVAMDNLLDKLGDIKLEAQSEKNRIMQMNYKEFADAFGIDYGGKAYSYIETMTLDPSAKIITFSDIKKQFDEYSDSHSYEAIRETAKQSIFSDMGVSKQDVKKYTQMLDGYEHTTTAKQKQRYDTVREELGFTTKEVGEIYNKIIGRYNELQKNTITNIGSYAAMRGYDVINAEGHGQSGSYTVILNRTKCIFRRDKK